MDSRLALVPVLLFLSGCAAPPEAAIETRNGAEGQGFREWTPEELLAAAQGQPLPPVPPEDGPTPEEIFEQAAPWALQPRERKPIERVTTHTTTHFLAGEAVGQQFAVLAVHTGEGDPTGPVHGLVAEMQWTDEAGLPWRFCVVRDDHIMPEVPCVEGTSPLRVDWRADPDDLPPGDYGVSYGPAGLGVDVVLALQATLEIRWTEFV